MAETNKPLVDTAGRRRDPHEYVCGIVRGGKFLDLRVDQLTHEEVLQVLCETFDLVDTLQGNLRETLGMADRLGTNLRSAETLVEKWRREG